MENTINNTKSLTRNYPSNFENIPSPCYVLEEEKFEKAKEDPEAQ